VSVAQAERIPPAGRGASSLPSIRETSGPRLRGPRPVEAFVEPGRRLRGRAGHHPTDELKKLIETLGPRHTPGREREGARQSCQGSVASLKLP
jgi:hypothetical protein